MGYLSNHYLMRFICWLIKDKNPSSLRHSPNLGSYDRNHLLSSLPRVGKHHNLKTLLVPAPNIWLDYIAFNNPEEKQGSLGCPFVRDGQKYCLREWEIQIPQSQLVSETQYQLTRVGSGFPYAVATPL